MHQGEVMLHQTESCFNESTTLMDERRTVDIVFLDFIKDFDTVPVYDSHREVLEVWAG